jgi:hypothetical protein
VIKAKLEQSRKAHEQLKMKLEQTENARRETEMSRR